MITFLRNIKRASDFFSIHPDGLSFVTERRLKDLEVSVNRLPKAIEDHNLTRMINLEHKIYEVEQIIESLETKRKEKVCGQLAAPIVKLKTGKKRKTVKLKAVEEEVKKVKSKLTQSMVKRLLEYRDGELYWKVDRKRVKKGDKAGTVNGRKFIGVNGRSYTFARIIFLMFHGYLPEYVSYIDGNELNTRIENLRAATASQIICHAKKPKNNTSGYKGVCFVQKAGKYRAQIRKKGKYHYLGIFDTPEEAYKAYCKAAKKLHGEFARVA